jgi:hypothetical protein
VAVKARADGKKEVELIQLILVQRHYKVSTTVITADSILSVLKGVIQHYVTKEAEPGQKMTRRKNKLWEKKCCYKEF